MKDLTEQAVLVRKVPYREADLVLTFVTRNLGKVSAVARSARKSRRRFGAALEPFRLLEIRLRPPGRGSLPVVTEAAIAEDFPRLHGHLSRIALAGYFAELVRETVPEGQPEPAVFELLVSSFRLLDRIPPNRAFVRSFELRLLDLLGFLPLVDRCAAPNCGRPVPSGRDEQDEDPWGFSVGLGGVLCPGCAQKHATVVDLPPRTVRSLQALAILPLAQAALTPPALSVEDNDRIQKALEAVLLDHIGHPLKSVEFIRQLQAARRTPLDDESPTEGSGSRSAEAAPDPKGRGGHATTG